MRILFLNPQGNFDPCNRYINQHPDFGGQLTYVRDTAKAIAKLGHKVDIITRRIIDDIWTGFESEIDQYPDTKNLRIIRINFGGEGFLEKEKLWPHIPNFVDATINFYKKEKSKIDFITSHYGDGGVAAALLSQKLNVPFSFTGHSLGAQKIDRLLSQNSNYEDLNKTYNFDIRIYAERIAMNRSAINIVSTSQERYNQYGHKRYKDAVDVNNDNRFRLITPGINPAVFNKDTSNDSSKTIKFIKKTINRDINKDRQKLPLIISASRYDYKKNHEGIIKAYANNPELQKRCNLMFVLRGVDNPFAAYSNVSSEEKKIVDTLMSYIKKHDLKGKVCFIDIAGQHNLATLYRYISKFKSLFTLTAFFEPFGLSPLEAMACGLPVVVTKNGGPSESLAEGDKNFGYLINPNNHKDIAKGFLTVLDNWQEYQTKAYNRVFSKYTWSVTAENYLKMIKEILDNKNKPTLTISKESDENL